MAVHGHIQRKIVEFCANEDSVIGTQADKDCSVVRLTKADDVTTPEGKSKSIRAVQEPRTLLWASIPCTGGSSWQNVNQKRLPGFEKKLRLLRKEFTEIWASFEEVAQECLIWGGSVVIEWPRNCSYWNLPRVKAFLAAHGLVTVRFDGCAFGMKSGGMPVKKPWKIATNNKAIREAFDGQLCPGHAKHTWCEARVTKPTENYTVEMAQVIRKAWRRSVLSSLSTVNLSLIHI